MNANDRLVRLNLPRDQKLRLLKLASLRHAARTGELWQGDNPRRLELSGPNGGPIELNVTKITSRVIDTDYKDITDVIQEASTVVHPEADAAKSTSTTIKVRTGVI